MRNIYYGLQNLWRWLPVIWRDRDWDHAFFARIIAHKARLMADHFEQHNDARIAKRLRMVAYLLTPENADRQWKYVDVRIVEIEGRIFGECLTPKFVRRAAATADERYTQYAFELMKKHFLTWWD